MQDHIENEASVSPITSDQDKVLSDADVEMNEHLSSEYKADLELIASRWKEEQPGMAGFINAVQEALAKGHSSTRNYDLQDLFRVSPEKEALSPEQLEAAHTYFSLMISQAREYGIVLRAEPRPKPTTTPEEPVNDVATGML